MHCASLCVSAELDLHQNGFLNTACFRPLSHLHALTLLDLSGCCLEQAPPILQSLTALRDLNLMDNRFLSDSSFQLLWGLTALTRLCLAHAGMRTLPPEVGALRNLVELDLRWSNPLEITAETAQALVQITGLTRLGFDGWTTPLSMI